MVLSLTPSAPSTIAEKVYGCIHPDVAIIDINIGQILKAKGDLDGALTYTQRALKIDTDHFGPNNPLTRTVAANLKLIEQEKSPTSLDVGVGDDRPDQ